MNILFTICGRAGSKGVKNKNLKDFLGKPLVYYTLDAINQYKNNYGDSDYIQTCLNTDSEELIRLVMKHTSDIFVVRRSKDLGGDSVAKIAVIKDCLKKAEKEQEIKYDMVVDLDITSPLRTVEDIKNAVDKKRNQQRTDLVFSVTDARRNPYFNMVKRNPDGTVSQVIKSDYIARQQAPEIFDMNASIYAYSSDFLRSNTSNLMFDGVCDIIKMRDTAVLDIDSEEDFKMMEIIAEYYFESPPLS